MRTYILLPLLALLNMGANAATIQNLISRHSGPHIRSPSQHLNNPISRQVHNADFSSDSSPLPGSQSSSDASPPTSGSAAASSRRAVAADPDTDANGDVDDQGEDVDALDGVLTTVSCFILYLILNPSLSFSFQDHGSEGDTVRLSVPPPRRRQNIAGLSVQVTKGAPSAPASSGVGSNCIFFTFLINVFTFVSPF